ncbi:DNA polymerase III subunit gamma/tau [Hathewaya histolytica]|uniref:DNA-directed DNA polymerase n=1 Tax=Hathewaya histolytica TaxID=1498 RepID=A0A4U9QTB4_HATHI|nr:DNA polymerase III subunit gamma/tau [Hathewaya histolytica]VTQ81662.1 DNA polymerase III subunits gamma and tau [Hathewaya histolytica]
MAYTALYREWRPKSFKDVVGQHHVTTTLKNQIKNHRIAHAYLLCGTRGTGKTSTAKILSKAVNCLNSDNGEPCNQCEMCKKINLGTAIDVVELDAASHNKVEHIRDIIEDVQYPPSEAKYKVYIVDEVHMLSISAVNAFLKTLEEPPANVVFILATTDPQKLPITILSRCQRFDFKRIKSEDIFERLRDIIDELGILADDKSLKLISRMCDGAMRDALSILDQVISMHNNKIDYESVVDILGLVTNENLIHLVDSIIDKNIDNSIKNLDDIILSGKDIYTFIKDMVIHMRNLMMAKISDNPDEILDMSSESIQTLKEQGSKLRVEEIMRYIRILQEAEEQCKWSKQGRIFLELAIIKMIKLEYDTSKEVLLARINTLEKALKEGTITIKSNKNDNIKINVEKKEESFVNKVEEEKISLDEEIISDENYHSNLTLEKVKLAWNDILGMLKARREMIIYASLATGKVTDFKNGVIYITYEENYAFNKRRLEQDQYRNKAENIFCEALKEKVKLRYNVIKQEEETIPEEILNKTFGVDKVEIIE